MPRLLPQDRAVREVEREMARERAKLPTVKVERATKWTHYDTVRGWEIFHADGDIVGSRDVAKAAKTLRAKRWEITVRNTPGDDETLGLRVQFYTGAKD